MRHLFLAVMVLNLFPAYIFGGQCPCRCQNKNQASKKAQKENIKDVYSKVAENKDCDGTCFGGRACACRSRISQDIGYTRQELDQLANANLGLGCGNPINLGEIKAGQTILDLGSGAGLDCFLAAKKVGPNGFVIGVDMTPSMIEKATKNAIEYGYENVEFRLGDIENLPVEDNSIDIIISNCVLSLAGSKEKAFRQAHRVLKPGGRMYVSDIVLLSPLIDTQKIDKKLRGTCVLGALLKDVYLAKLESVGFEVHIMDEDLEVNEKKFGDTSLAISSLKYIAIKPGLDYTIEQRREENRLSQEWIQKNTKPCPQCGVRIEKNGGCNYIKCTQCGCGFCYYCFKDHHGGPCPKE
ncbi:arsenite methyltransferase [Candidatus Dependentiae bacterium]